MRKIFIAVIVAVTLAFMSGIWYGGRIGDFIETETVGSVMCLSCMGIE